MEVPLQSIIDQYKGLLAEANHQLLCHRIAVKTLEVENSRLHKELIDATLDRSNIEYTTGLEEEEETPE